jgi:hypothetical protein
VNGAPRKIVGVLPPDFRFLSSEARIFLPFTSRLQQRTPQQRHSGGGGTHMIARLKPGATVAEAQSQIDAHNAGVEKDNPRATMMAEAGFRSPVLPLHADHVRSIRPTLLLMQGSALFLLVMGAVNLVNLLLIRASSHMKDMAIRRSMGASRRHVVSHVMVETLLLTALGGLLGLVVGASGIRLLEVLGADRLPLGARIAFDGRLAATGLAGAVVLGVVIAVPIAWFNLRSHLEHALRSESRTGTVSRAAQRLRQGFIVAQIALAFVLLAGAGAAWAEPEKRDGRFSGLSRRSRAHRTIHPSLWPFSERITPTRRGPRSLAGGDRATAGSCRGRNDHQRSAERRQRQDRDRRPGDIYRSRANRRRVTISMASPATTSRPSAFRCAKDGS